MTRRTEARYDAMVALLAQPDEPCLRRGHHDVLPGKGDPDVIKRDLGTAYVQRRRQDLGEDISCVVSVRRGTRLRVVGGRHD